MKITRNEVEEILVLLEETPQRIMAALADSKKDVYFKPNPKTWSVNEIFMHLRSCADVWGDTIDAMLVKDKPTLAEIHPNMQLKKGNYKDEEFVTSLRVFMEQREKFVRMLRAVYFEDWSRGAMIGGHPHTIFSQARRMAKHESGHCGEIEALLNAD